VITENWFDSDLAIVDVETTGLDPKVDRVIEIGIVHMRAGEMIERWEQLVNPGREVPPEVVELTGIQPESLGGAPTFDEIAPQVRARIEGKVLVAYNLAFDSAFIKTELDRSGFTWQMGPSLDPLVFARELQKDDGSKRLGKVAARLGIELNEAHRAANDAEVTGYILYAFRDQLPPRLEDLTILQSQWSAQQEQLMAARRRMRGDFRDDADALPVVTTLTTEDGIILGPAYIYGAQPDPLRFFYGQLPDVNSGRR